MARSVLTNLQVPFGAPGDTFKPQVVITGHPGIEWLGRGIPFRVYPAGCVINCSSGSVSMDTTRQVDIPGDFVSFSGSSTSLRYQPDSAPTIDFLWGFDEHGVPVAGTSVKFSVNLKTGQVTSSKPFTGLVRVGAYKATYQLIWYKPETKVANLLGSSFAALHVEYGVICAYKDGGIAIQQVDLPDVRQDTDKVELWRVTSKTVIDPDGEWEYPSNWGTNYGGKYPDGKTGPNKDSSAVKERVHEIGYITATGGTVWYDAFPKFLLQPYQSPTQSIRADGTLGMQPVIDVRYQSPQSLFPNSISAQNAAGFAIELRRQLPSIR